MEKTWTPNDLQKRFLEALADGSCLTLEQISEKLGVDIKSGSINVLLTKGLVEHGDDVKVEVVRLVPRKTYKLAE